MWWFSLVVRVVDLECGWDESLAVWCVSPVFFLTLDSYSLLQILVSFTLSHSQNTKDNSPEALS
jgi:hypothetical protein